MREHQDTCHMSTRSKISLTVSQGLESRWVIPIVNEAKATDRPGLRYDMGYAIEANAIDPLCLKSMMSVNGG